MFLLANNNGADQQVHPYSLISALVIQPTLISLILAGKRRGRRWRRKLASAVKWKGNRLKKLKNRVDFPDNIRFDLSIAGVDVQELNLKKNRRMRRARRHRAGKKLRRKNRRRKKVQPHIIYCEESRLFVLGVGTYTQLLFSYIILQLMAN